MNSRFALGHAKTGLTVKPRPPGPQSIAYGNQQQREPFAATLGSGDVPSSDGQFFQTTGLGRDGSRLNARYGPKPGFRVYTHLSDRDGSFLIKVST